MLNFENINLLFFTNSVIYTKVKSINFANACNYTAHLDLWRIQEVIDYENGILTFTKNYINSPERNLRAMQQWSCNGIMTQTVNFSLQATKGWRKNSSIVNIKKFAIVDWWYSSKEPICCKPWSTALCV